MTVTQLPNEYGPKTTLPTQQNYVRGAYLASTSGKTFVTRHPGNEHDICEVEEAGEREIDEAVAAARAAFESWSATPAAERGNPFDRDTQLGPLISREHYEKVLGYMAEAKKSNARHICGGEMINDGDLAGGLYVTPAIFADCEDEMSFVRDEVFGPLMSVLSFQTEDEAIERANGTHFGLSGAV